MVSRVGTPRSRPHPALPPTRMLADALERISDSFVALDRDWRYTYVNKKAAETFDRRPEDLIGRHIWTEFPEGVGQPFYHAYHRAMAEQVPIHLEEYYSPLDRWFENHIYPSPDGLSIFFQDTTERRKAEDDLRVSREQLSLALDAARMGTFEWDLTTQHVAWSHGQQILSGVPLATFAGTYEAVLERIHPEDRREVDADVARCLAERAPFAHEFRVVWPDGTERWIGAHGEFSFDEHDQPLRMRGIAMDVTRRRRAESIIRRSQHELAEAQALARLGSWELELATGHATWSQEMFRLTGRDPALGPPSIDEFMDWVHPDDRHRLYAMSERTQHSGERLEFEMRSNPARGPVKHLQVIMTADLAASSPRLTGTTQDVTERFAAQEELERSRGELRSLAGSLITAREEERARMAREIHDECGQMLTGLKMDTAWLGRHLTSTDATFRGKIAAMSQLVDGAVQTVRQIATQLRPGILDDLGLAAAIEWQAEQFAGRTGIACDARAEVSHSDLRPNVAISVFRIFQECLTNVARHAGARRVSVVLTEDRHDLLLEVRDDGRGIAESDTRNPLSIGLIGMRERALLVGGVLSVTGAVGEGTTVRVRIPRHLPEAAP